MKRRNPMLSSALQWPLWIAAGLISVLFVAVPLDLKDQCVFAGCIVIAAIFLNHNKGRRMTLVLAGLAVLISTRYMYWRTTQTLQFETGLEVLLGGGLYLAELYAWVIMILGFLQTSWPLSRPVVEIEGEPEAWPFIDVYIPTYNESLSIVRTTVFAAMDMDYPADRFRVFILDDGRRDEFKEFALEAKCGYLTRPDNLHAKAGNLNAAMRKTDGELILIFDCDHVPTRAFLQLTVGWFQKDKKLALMQTPHHFYSADPVQRNLGSVDDLPGEGDLFYGAVQQGNDLWNATFFCGSCAIIRREALLQTNGFAGETVTEDAHTALKLQRMGWNTAYLPTRLSAGLATERLILHIGQRVRWARGMTQIFRIDNPLFGKGLNVQQRLCYLNAMLHFQFPLPRIVFLTSPLAFLIAGQNIIHASAALIFAYALPHLVLSTLSGERTQGADRRPFWGEIYETLLAFHLVKPTLLTLLQPRKGKFNVTDKGDLLDRTFFDFNAVRPHMIVIGIMIFGVIFGTARLLLSPVVEGSQVGTLVLNLSWATFSLAILLAAVSVAREKRQLREHIRIESKLPATLYLDDGHVFDCRTIDFSTGGASVKLPEGLDLTGREVTSVSIPMGNETLTVPVSTVRTGGGVARLHFEQMDQLHTRQLVRAVMGRADAWVPDEAQKPVSGFQSFGDILKVDLLTLKRIVRPSLRSLPVVFALIAIVSVGGGAFMTAYAETQVAAPAAATEPAQASNDGQREATISLKDLLIKQPIRLAGTRGEIGIPFGLRADEVVTKATMTIDAAYSPALLGDLSQLVVMMNGEVVSTVELEPDASDGMRLTLDVEPALFLAGENQLNLRFLGHYARDCEDPFHSSLWMNVSNERTFFDLTTQRLQLPPDLSRLPLPFFDTHDPMPLRLPFVMSANPTDGELEAAGTVSSWFGSLASYRGFSFPASFDALPSGNAVVFITAQRSVPGIEMDVTGPSIAVIQNPVDEYGQLLLVMGRDEAELKRAATGLAFTEGLIGGATASMDSFRAPVFNKYQAPRWLRTDRPVELEEIAEPFSLQARGLPPGPLSARFRVAPDLFLWPKDGVPVDLRYRFPTASWLDRRASRMDISLNSNFLRTLPLGGNTWVSQVINGEETVSRDRQTRITLPRYNLFGQNEIIFDYNMVLADKSECVGMLPDNVMVSVLPDSTIDLTGAHHFMKMPDLSPFAGSGYPFTIRPDLADTAILLPEKPSASTIEAFLMLLGRFGDATGVAASRAVVTRQVSTSRLQDKDILVLGPPALAANQAIFAKAPVSYQNGRLEVPIRTIFKRMTDVISKHDVDPVGEANEMLYGSERFAGMVGFESPLGSGRSIVAILASDTTDLPLMISSLQDTKFLAQVQGDLSILNGDEMSSYVVGDSYEISDLPWWLALAYWLSARPFIMAAGGIVVVLVIAGPIAAVLKRQERRRLEDMESE